MEDRVSLLYRHRTLADRAKTYNNGQIIRITFQILLGSAKLRSKKKKLDFNLTLLDLCNLYDKQNGRCYYSGLAMVLRFRSSIKKDPLLISLDRKDSSKGYTKDNVVLCCWWINHAKETDDMKTFCKNLKMFYEAMEGRAEP